MKSPINSTPIIAPDYYLTNFKFLVNWVVEHYHDLLNEEERHFIQCFQQLDYEGQCLLVRLLSRKGSLFRADKLCYAEIKSIDKSAEELIAARLMSRDFPLSVNDIATVLTKVELLFLFNDQLRAIKNERKEVLIAKLAEAHSSSKTWEEWTENKFGFAYYIDNESIVSNLLLLFFGNAYQDLTEFVLQDLGLYRYEQYSIDHEHRVFKSRAELEHYQQLLRLRQLLDVANDLQHLIDIAEQLPNSFTTESMQRKRGRLCNQLAYEFERKNQPDIAYSLYEQTHLVPARERRIRLLEKREHYESAWELLNQSINLPSNEHELQVAERIAPRLARKLGKTVNKKIKPGVLEQHLTLLRLCDEENNFLSVEDIARLHFHSDEEPCIYVENQLLGGLFGLWLWPEMFRSIDGAFSNPFQSAPLDMYQENFSKNRPELKKLWQLLEDESHGSHMRTTWKERYGIANHFVNWQVLDENILELAINCIPARHLKLIFERLLFDLKENRSGLPDLIQFFPLTNTYRMIEVKGPGDRIQDNQQRWINFFIEQNIPVEVCYVHWQ